MSGKKTKQNELNEMKLKLENLYLDPNNYRLIHEKNYVKVEEGKFRDKTVQRRTMRLITGDKNQHIQDLIYSFKVNDYLPIDQIQVKPLENGDYLVVEGNRRIATLKHLYREFDEKGIDLQELLRGKPMQVSPRGVQR